MVPCMRSIKDWILMQKDNVRRYLGIALFDRRKEFGVCMGSWPVLFIRWDAKLGDSIVSSWVARELKKCNPEREVWVVTSPSMKDFYKNEFLFDRVLTIKKRPSYRELKALCAEIGCVDYVVHFGKRLKMKDLFFLSRVKTNNIIGLDDKIKLINIKLGGESEKLHFVEKFKLALNKMGIVHPDSSYIVPKNHSTISKIKQKLKLQWPEDKRILCFNPFGSSSSRKMSVDLSVSLINEILDKSDANVVLLCADDMKSEARKIIHMVSDVQRLYLYDEQSSLDTLVALMELSSGVISVDTATVHIASGLNKPLLAIYNNNPGNYSEWHPNSSMASVIFSSETLAEDINRLSVETFGKEFSSWYNKFFR
ncbi:hypothetical protein WP2S18C03_00800 [Aeromonas veronii]|nr:hypothetical protein WP2S18C03_00800 [Aeromonas veronii]